MSDQRKEHSESVSSITGLVRDVFSVILELENSLETERKQLTNRRDFTLMGAFNYFSSSPQYKLTIDEYQFGLERLGINVDPRYVSLLFSRYDSDQDGRLGLGEFSN